MKLRTMWLIVIGLLHAHLIWSGDILYGYGVVGLLLFPLRRLSAKALIITGTVLILIHSLQGLGAGIGIGEMRDKAIAAEKAANPTEEQQKALQEWKQLGEMFEPKKAEVEKQIQTHRGGWVENLPLRSGEAAMFEFTMFFQFLFLDVLDMLVMGMGLAKAGVFDASRSYGFYAVLAGVSFLATAGMFLGMGLMGAAPTSLDQPTIALVALAIFDGLFVFHYFVEMFIWKFSDPHFRQTLSSLYFSK